MSIIKNFNQFLQEAEVHEGIMSEIDAIGQRAHSRDEFIRDVQQLLRDRSYDKSAAGDIAAIERMSAAYFDDDGKRHEPEFVTEGKAWTKQSVQAAMDRLRAGLGKNPDASLAYDAADSWLADNPEAEEFIKKTFDVDDAKSWIANNIA